MARKTNKEQVLTLAAQLGVEVEYGQMGEDGFEVALYGYGAHMAFDPMGEGHTAITNQAGSAYYAHGRHHRKSEAGIWGDALRDLREFVPCADNCHCRAVDADLDVVEVEPEPEPEPEPVTRHYVIANTETGAEHTGSVIGCCAPVEAMRTMIGIVANVSRETVRIWETDNHREYGFDTRPGGPRGIARFTDPAPNPYRPAPVTLTHSNLHRNS